MNVKFESLPLCIIPNLLLLKYTAKKRTLQLVYFETFTIRSEAIKRERQIKAMKSRKYISQMIAEWF
jgi:predicted GIY-YIG superfamily endonuclease